MLLAMKHRGGHLTNFRTSVVSIQITGPLPASFRNYSRAELLRFDRLA